MLRRPALEVEVPSGEINFWRGRCVNATLELVSEASHDGEEAVRASFAT